MIFGFGKSTEWKTMFVFQLLIFIFIYSQTSSRIHFFKGQWDPYDMKYGHFPESERLEMLDATRKMFHFGYDNYMKYAYPEDELNPIYCKGRGHDHENP